MKTTRRGNKKTAPTRWSARPTESKKIAKRGARRKPGTTKRAGTASSVDGLRRAGGPAQGGEPPASSHSNTGAGEQGPPDTRQRIVLAARELFHQHGFHATSMADILKKAEANSGSLYYFFKSKDELLLAVLGWYEQMLWPMVMGPAFAQTDDPIERVFAVLAGYRQMLIATKFRLGCPIGNLALELGEAEGEVREKIAMNFTNWCKAVERCLGEAAPRLPDDLDRARMARFVLTIMEGGIMQARSHRAIEPYDDAVVQLRDYFNRLLARHADQRND